MAHRRRSYETAAQRGHAQAHAHAHAHAHKRTSTVQARASMSSIHSATTSPERKGKSQPLRRGDACLMCRAKKLKCSATKPSCDQCAKRQDRCVYDAVRPASRVEKLEKKLAEMEDAENNNALQIAAERRRSSDTLSVEHNALGFNMGLPTQAFTPMTSPFDYGMLSYHPISPGYAQHPQTHNIGPQPLTESSLQSLTSWQWPQSTHIQTPLTHLEPLHSNHMPDGMPWSVLSASNNVSKGSPFWTAEPSPGFDNGTMDLTPPGTTTGTPAPMNMDPSLSLLNPNNNNYPSVLPSNLSLPLASFRPDLDPNPLSSPMPDIASKTFDEILNHASAVSTLPQIDEKDISQSARDYLIDLFFSPTTVIFANETIMETRFKNRLLGPEHQQPHPCLLFSMYTVAASGSYIPAVRALAESLYRIALAKLEDAITKEDRLLDAINAIKNLGKWLYLRNRLLEGYQTLSRGISLAMACGLHQIGTSALGCGITEGPLGEPKDQVDVCDRIYTFWALWAAETGGSVTVPWPSLLRDETIATPLPRHPDEYVNGNVLKFADMNIKDIYSLSSRGDTSLPAYSPALLMISLHLLSRAKGLRDQPVASSSPYKALPVRQPNYNAKRDHPEIYKEIMDTCSDVERRIPQDLRLDFSASSSWDNSDLPLTYICLLTARLVLHTPDPSDMYELETILSHTRQLTQIIRAWSPHLNSGGSEERDGGGKKDKGLNAGGWILSTWIMILEIMIKSAKMFGKLGREMERMELENNSAYLAGEMRNLGFMYQNQ